MLPLAIICQPKANKPGLLFPHKTGTENNHHVLVVSSKKTSHFRHIYFSTLIEWYAVKVWVQLWHFVERFICLARPQLFVLGNFCKGDCKFWGILCLDEEEIGCIHVKFGTKSSLLQKELHLLIVYHSIRLIFHVVMILIHYYSASRFVYMCIFSLPHLSCKLPTFSTFTSVIWSFTFKRSWHPGGGTMVSLVKPFAPGLPL